ncbi:hypothetical protein PISMIDRAFT_261404 [Pisolithus microcarpus 441]|uniref:Uncharacterized protein n=1 Tax=Pisolithus microcarpus 441 TaxID=765257 RepID=A0A0C9ZWG9_9AGAM|nr:hypothetical protein PISMIDRAFT_261404 [Pisolithus microcarpus 441]
MYLSVVGRILIPFQQVQTLHVQQFNEARCICAPKKRIYCGCTSSAKWKCGRSLLLHRV